MISVISYGITLYFPNLSCYDPRKLNELRYWYYSAVSYCCHSEKSLLGWTNSSKTMTEDTSIQLKLEILTGLPSLTALYLSSCVSYYSHVAKLVTEGYLDNIVRIGRNEKLHYIYSDKSQRNDSSPIKLLIMNVNNMTNYSKRPVKGVGLLPEIERRARELSIQDIRMF